MKRRTVLATMPVVLAGCTGDFRPKRGKAETLIQEAINAERARLGVGKLSEREELVTAARAHSRDMHKRDFYAHKNPDGEQPWDRVNCRAAENIHRGELGEMQNRGSSKVYDTYQTDELAAYVVEGWMQSRQHYQIMTDAKFSSIGVGLYIGDVEFFATAMFC